MYYNDSVLYYKSDKPYLQDNSRKYRNLYTLNVDEYYKRPRSGMRTVSINEDENTNPYVSAQFAMPPNLHHQQQHMINQPYTHPAHHQQFPTFSLPHNLSTHQCTKNTFSKTGQKSTSPTPISTRVLRQQKRNWLFCCCDTKKTRIKIANLQKTRRYLGRCRAENTPSFESLKFSVCSRVTGWLDYLFKFLVI